MHNAGAAAAATCPIKLNALGHYQGREGGVFKSSPIPTVHNPSCKTAAKHTKLQRLLQGRVVSSCWLTTVVRDFVDVFSINLCQLTDLDDEIVSHGSSTAVSLWEKIEPFVLPKMVLIWCVCHARHVFSGQRPLMNSFCVLLLLRTYLCFTTKFVDVNCKGDKKTYQLLQDVSHQHLHAPKNCPGSPDCFDWRWFSFCTLADIFMFLVFKSKTNRK